jgi:hypothetical protein
MGGHIKIDLRDIGVPVEITVDIIFTIEGIRGISSTRLALNVRYLEWKTFVLVSNFFLAVCDNGNVRTMPLSRSSPDVTHVTY